MSVNIARTDRNIALFFLLSVLLLGGRTTITAAHEGETETSNLEGYSVTVTPREVMRGDEIPIGAHIENAGAPLSGSTVTFTVDRHEEGISDRLPAKEREPGSYTAKYRFTRSGEYEIHVEFTDTGETKRVTASVNVLGTPFWTARSAIGLGAGVVALIVLIIGIIRKKLKSAIAGAVAVLIAGGIGYSLLVTFKSGATGGIITPITKPNGSIEYILTGHFHTYVPISICSKDFRLPTEIGPLTGPHTHEEKNIIHWHDRLPYDKVNNVLKDTMPLTLGAFFDAIKIPFDKRTIATAHEGDACNGKSGSVILFVNGVRYEGDPRAFVWKNKDVVRIFFDSRPLSEIEEEVKNNPIRFPSLGRG